MALNKKGQDELKLDDKEEETRWEMRRDQMRILYETRKDELRLDNKEEKEIPWD